MAKPLEFVAAARPLFGTVSGSPACYRIAVRNVTQYRHVAALAEQFGYVAAPSSRRFPELMKLTPAAEAIADVFERRAQELMLNPEDKRAYLRLMRDSERGEYSITCPDCGTRFESYETETLKHVRTCQALRRATEARQ